MKLIRPVAIDYDVDVIASTAAETHSAYSLGATYAQGARVIEDHVVYESLQDDNVGRAPIDSPAWWIEVGPDNRSAAFDSKISTTTQATAPWVVQVAPGRVDSIAVVGIVDATSLTVSVAATDGGPAVYERTIDLIANEFTDWYGYFFDEYDLASEIVLTDLPATETMVVTLSVGVAGNVEVGVVLFGLQTSLGVTLAGVSTGITDYSRKETDEYGNATLVQRAYARKADLTVMVETASITRVLRTLSTLRATPTVWVPSAEDQYAGLVVYGWYKDFAVDISYPTFAQCSLQIEGLT